MGSILFKFFTIFSLGLLVSTTTFAKKERYQNSLEGSKGNLKKDSSMAVSDSNNTYPAVSWNSYMVLRVNELYGKPGVVAMADSFKATINFTIAYKAANSNTLLYKDSSLVLSFNRLKASNFRVEQMLGPNHYLLVTITDVIIEQAQSSAVLPYLILDTYLDIDRVYELNCTSNLIKNLVHDVDPLITERDELLVRWDKVVAADEYDLEWAWIDLIALAQGNYGSSVNPDLNRIFANNASRVTLTKEQYKVPLLYDDNGYLFYRVRPVQYSATADRKTGVWSVPNTDGNGSERFTYAGHERKFNWQASTTFAEDGKRKSVVQYFDGDLKSRQTVTKDNTTGTTVVAETLYDRQGRPTVQVLPAPTLNNLIKYTPKFTVDVNGAEFDKNAYDRLITPSEFCGVVSSPMGTQNGAGKYYSSANADNSIANNKFIPNAYGFPYSETRYTPDNTGRIIAQSGVGALYSLGGGRETKYYYSVPTQEQLDALFGTEAGYANFYQKTMVKDPNGQYSVSYTDMSGKTIATALAGVPPANLTTIPNYKEQTITESLLSKQNTYIEGTTIINNSNLLVPKAGVHTFNYALTPQVLQGVSLITPSVPVCYDCLYDVVITISSDCNNKGLPGDTAYKIIRTNVQIGAPDSICGNNSAASIGVTFNISLPEGSYNITKRLSISDSSMSKYREIYMRHNTLKTKQDFINEWTTKIQSGTPCQLTCESCTSLKQTTKSAFIQNYITSLSLPQGTDITDYTKEAEATYDRLYKQCENICDGYSDAINYRELMLSDMIAPSGQYARPANHANDPSYTENDPSTYAGSFGVFSYGVPPLYTFPTYKDANGIDQKILYNGVLTSPRDLPEDVFVENFESQWAESLLPYHPEYDRLLKFESYKPSHKWNEEFDKVESYSEALSKGYLTPAGSISGYSTLQGSIVDPFFISQTAPLAGEPGLVNSFRNKLLAYKDVYVDWQSAPITLNLWQFVNLNVSCIRPNTTVTQQCFQAAINSSNVFSPNYLCENDLQMAWKMFRDLYIQLKKSYVNEQILLIATNPQLVVVSPAVSRFIKLEDVLSQFSINNNMTPTDFNNITNQAIEQQAASTCSSYAELWWQQLAPCEISEAEKSTIINQMIEVCKRGFDAEHPTGASSLNKAKYPTYAPESFVAIIQQWAVSNNKDVSKCNGYLIDAPKPYNVPAILVSKPLVEKPDDCACNRITELKAEAGTKGYTNNLSGYLKQYYKTNIRQGELDTLSAACAGTLSNCRFMASVINLPPVLQCLPTPACLTCDEVKALKDTFTIEYPGTLYYNATTVLQSDYNKLFTNYMNYKTGFGYSHVEYMQFLDNCASGFSDNTECTDLQTTLAAFKNQYYKAPLNLYNANTGCDTGRWVSNYGQGKLQVTPLSEELIDGLFVPKVINSTTFSSVDYYDTVCLGNKLTFETRIKMPRTGLAYNPYASEPYNTFSLSNGFYFKAPGDTISGYEYVNLPIDNYSGYSQLHSVHSSYGAIGPVILPVNLDSFRVIKVEVLPDSFRYYIDDVFIKSFPHQTYTHFYGYYYGPLAASMRIDWTKITDEHGQVIMFEDFNSCTNLAQINKEPCKDACQPAFTTYFNQAKGTNYTTAQIDSLYSAKCGILPYPCETTTRSALKLCGQANTDESTEEIKQEDACSDVTQLGVEKGTLAWQHYQDSINNDFDRLYLEKCMAAVDFESFTVQHVVAEYHYTLYYYDRADNLVKTVPPQSVMPNYDATWLAAVKTARANGQSKTISHNLATNYRYNSLNQVVAQITPDAGLSKFWYDRIGRLVLSQNAKQAQGSKYSYTLYDALGRITEVGQKKNSATVVDQALSRSITALSNFINYNNSQFPQTEVTNTVYDKAPVYNTAGMPPGFAQQTYTLRNRVSYTRYFDTYVYTVGGEVDPLQYNTATYYNYDIHGNVKQLLNDYTGSMLGTLQSNKFKLIEYMYDLVSGKVNQVNYQPGKADQFYHRYQYDAENRITDVYTTTNPLFVGNTTLEDHDAYYQYYKHGPLSRLVLGTQQVQGVDYAYTLQGWLKGVNSTAVKPQWDMGADGATGSSIARDAYGFGLYYAADQYEANDNVKDYVPINTSVAKPFAKWAYLFGAKALYNGNISATSVHIPSVGSPLMNTYRYDQLNRLRTMKVTRYNDVMFNENNLGYNPPAITDFNEDVTYDANGNILTYVRNGNTIAGKPLAMDNLKYFYTAGTNRLSHISDAVSKTNYTEDIDNQESSNYSYDAIGNLIKDKAEGIDDIEWTVYGKIKKIIKKDGTTITYQYSADGNRISKEVTKGTETSITAYVRDAQGNVMGVYNKQNNKLVLQEQHIYGSSRLGIYKPFTDVTILLEDAVYPRLKGNTAYELTNHLGNVLATVRDVKKTIIGSNNLIDYFEADVITANDYYPFGMPIPGRNKYETETTETKQVEVCISCTRVQDLVENYFAVAWNNGAKSGSEAAMLTYIQSELLNVDNLNYTTAQISSVLASCNTGWSKNVAFWGFNAMIGGGAETRFTTQNFSIETWIKPTQETSTIQNVANALEHIGNVAGGYRVYILEGKLYFQIANFGALPASGGSAQIRTTAKIDLNKWHHVVAVRHGNNASDFKIYIDGVAVSTEIVNGMSYLINGNVYNEYNSRISFGYGLKGLLKNIRVYNRPVTATEADANYHACNETPTDNTGIKVWYKVNEGTTSYWVTDYGPHGLTAANPSYQWSGGGLAMASECLPDLNLLCNTVTQTVPKVQGYRYGFNGKENDNEPKGVEGSQQDYGMRIYDPRVGRFLSLDPITKQYPELTPYQFASNTPIQAVDLDGLEAKEVYQVFNPAGDEIYRLEKNVNDPYKLGGGILYHTSIIRHVNHKQVNKSTIEFVEKAFNFVAYVPKKKGFLDHVGDKIEALKEFFSAGSGSNQEFGFVIQGGVQDITKMKSNAKHKESLDLTLFINSVGNFREFSGKTDLLDLSEMLVGTSKFNEALKATDNAINGLQTFKDVIGEPNLQPSQQVQKIIPGIKPISKQRYSGGLGKDKPDSVFENKHTNIVDSNGNTILSEVKTIKVPSKQKKQ